MVEAYLACFFPDEVPGIDDHQAAGGEPLVRGIPRGARAGDAPAYRSDRPHPVEYPTTRKVGATPQARAADINAAFADAAIRGILTVTGGEDQITVIPHLDAELARHDPKPFLGMSDNTHARKRPNG